MKKGGDKDLMRNENDAGRVALKLLMVEVAQGGSLNENRSLNWKVQISMRKVMYRKMSMKEMSKRVDKVET